MANYAFIDGTNLHLSTENLGWSFDWRLFREYLAKKHRVTKAYYFVGYSQHQIALYDNLNTYGYELIHRTLLIRPDGDIKGDCDTELVLHTMIQWYNYGKAVIVTGDGDMACLVRHLDDTNKFKLVIACKPDSCSKLIRQASNSNIMYVDYYRHMFEKKKREQK
ncbi:hypothetical protein ES703_80634 [subsurface metagenome]